MGKLWSPTAANWRKCKESEHLNKTTNIYKSRKEGKPRERSFKSDENLEIPEESLLIKLIMMCEEVEI